MPCLFAMVRVEPAGLEDAEAEKRGVPLLTLSSSW